MIRWSRPVALVVGFLMTAAIAAPASAHGPNPVIGTTLWGRDQVVPYTWDSALVPPAWMVAAIDAGAADVGESRGSRAALFVRQAGAASRVAYGLTPCPSYGIACMDRTGVPNKFAGMWFRPQGWSFDWGTLRWCQYYATFPTGCYDVENVSLDELGHMEILWHHVNYSDESDYLDSVVQASAHTKGHVGWNEHVFGRCDTARLQLEYERQSASDRVSTCLSLATALTLTATPTSAYLGTTVTFASSLRIGVASSAEAMSGDALSSRTVLLQRRPVGSSTWTTVATMAPGPSGAYTASWSPTDTYDWRASFATPANEGIKGTTSPVERVTISGCSGIGCPQSVGVEPMAGTPLQTGP
jgi:hypothetical protein